MSIIFPHDAKSSKAPTYQRKYYRITQQGQNHREALQSTSLLIAKPHLIHYKYNH